jgi:hypothetical protein
LLDAGGSAATDLTDRVVRVLDGFCDALPGHLAGQADDGCRLRLIWSRSLSGLGGRRRHAVHLDDFEPEAGDPLHKPGEGCRVWQLRAKGGGARADGDLAVVEFRAQRGACLAGEGDLIRL